MQPRPRLACQIWLAAAACFTLAAGGCRDRDTYPSRPITLICPWAAGGGTDRVSRQIAAHLEHVLGEPVSVVNATGGKGVTGHARGLHARPDGYTLTMTTLELNMMHWGGLTNLTYRDCIPLMSVNEDYAALFVRSDSPWKDLSELKAAIRQNPGKLQASGTATGGAWHLALAGWLIADGFNADDVNWISSEGAGPSLQQLMGGGFDMVCCSLPEADTLYRAGEVRALGVMAPQRAPGYDAVLTFIEQGSNWTLGGWRGLAVPLGTPPEIVHVLEDALRKVVTGQSRIPTHGNSDGTTFPEFMQAQGFDNTWRAADDFRAFLAQTDEKLGALLTSEALASVNRDRFDPMAFPYAILGLMLVTSLGLSIQRYCRGVTPGHEQTTVGAGGTTRMGIVNFAVFVAAVVAYLVLAETVGFVLLAGLLLFGLFCLLRVRIGIAAPLAVLFVILVNQMFVHWLRVPLPRGWVGW